MQAQAGRLGNGEIEDDEEMSKPELGTLEPVDLRKAWEHEAHDFTPWLAERLDLLGAVVGIELEHESSEKQVGPYRADIVARVPRDGGRVLIENQLEDANLQHLGQVMAYLAGLEAKVVIWIAKGFDEAHLSAIRWLNDHTVDPYAFFAVRVRVVRIGDSPLAPVFEVMEHPNNWDRTVKETTRREGLSKIGQFRRDFWTHLAERHPGEVRPGYAASSINDYVEGTNIFIARYLSADKVGIWLGSRGKTSADALPDVEPYLGALRAALAGEEISPSGGTFLETDTSERANWDRMADWLRERREIYERAVREAEV